MNSWYIQWCHLVIQQHRDGCFRHGSDCSSAIGTAGATRWGGWDKWLFMVFFLIHDGIMGNLWEIYGKLWLVGGLEHECYFFCIICILGKIIPTDYIIFFKMVKTTNQLTVCYGTWTIYRWLNYYDDCLCYGDGSKPMKVPFFGE